MCIAFIRPVEYNHVEGGIAMGYITASQAADKWKISQRRVQILCSQNRLEGIFKLGDAWAIPEDAPKPKDNRKKKRANEKEPALW
jgi:hypothetical protein